LAQTLAAADTAGTGAGAIGGIIGLAAINLTKSGGCPWHPVEQTIVFCGLLGCPAAASILTRKVRLRSGWNSHEQTEIGASRSPQLPFLGLSGKLTMEMKSMGIAK
jgi:hypothetical protein